ncbi:HCLS1-binding protein 3 [Dromiciops gliroides]|uniref:HCLS1-binding protein 3 n=1 Tax=Dromiciops gliroides TaxID=33562 RepID=UPI001CC808EA|nr:HCLS1-binding protein 3 [Dromiciops gliroides]
MQPGPSVLVASRQVQNTHTGLDLSVPTYQEVRGKMMSGHVEYQIVVVTWLPAFKSAKHRADDIVQFMVSKKYSEIEEFYQKLTSRYPQAALPLLPRKILFVGESDIRERRAMFNDIMRQIAKDGELATSPELLEFLGTKPSGGIDLPGRSPPEQEKDEADGEAGDDLDFFQEPDKTLGEVPLPSSLSHRGEEEKEEEEEEEEEVLDPLGIMRSKKPKKPAAPIQARPKETPLGSGKESRPKLTIFDDEANEEDELFRPQQSSSAPWGPSRDGLRLFDDPDLGGKVSLGDSLLLPAACERPQEPTLGPTRTDISDDLFGVEDLDKILSLGSQPRPQALPRARPRVPAKPAIPKKPVILPPKVGAPELRAAPREDQPQVRAEALDELGILKYIQEQNSAQSTAPSLF